MEMTLIYTVIGFALAGYSVIANDSIQTLGTFIASKKKWFKWYVLAGSASGCYDFSAWMGMVCV
jgi:GH15 family glucan-1,4-alpha-glucosidase